MSNTLPTKQEVIQSQIDSIMDWFDFAKVHAMMKAANWTWATIEGVPSEPEIRAEARRLLKAAAKSAIQSKLLRDHIYTGIGGFTVQIELNHDKDDTWVRVNLSFGIETHNDGESYQPSAL